MHSAIFAIVANAQSSVVRERDLPSLCVDLLRAVLELSEAGYGFVARVGTDEPERQLEPLASVRLRPGATAEVETMSAIVSIPALDPIDEAITAARATVIDAHTTTRAMPTGHPPVANGVILPFPAHGIPRGVLVLANRRGGWGPTILAQLLPAIDACGGLFEADATQRRLAQQEGELSAILAAVPDGIVTVDGSGLIWGSNPAADALLGGGAPVLGRTLESLLTPEGASELAPLLGSLDRNDAPHDAPRLVTTRSMGPWAPLEVRVRGAGLPGRLLCVFRDLAEETQLRAERDRYFRLAPEVLVSIDVAGRFRNPNPAFVRVLGWSEEGTANRAALSFVHPADRTRASACMVAARAGLPGDPCRARVETAAGQWRWLDWTLASDPVTGGVFMAGRDVTDREEASRVKDEFVSVVSHELRTPLTSIRGSLGLLASGVVGPIDEADSRELIDVALSNTERLIRLVNDILDLDRGGRGGAALRMEELDAAALIGLAVDAVSHLLTAGALRLRVEAPPGLRITGDRDRLVQVLVNLLGNAIKFSEPGALIRVVARAEPDGTLLGVQDQGPGIDPDQLPLLFEPFRQGDSSDTRAKGGTGLGLAICRAIVEHHGGWIDVSSQPGTGSWFHFLLPSPARSD